MQNDFCFLHVDTKSNPADLLSRGTTTKNLFSNTLRFQGPRWVNDEAMWPKQMICAILTIKEDTSIEKSKDKTQMVMDVRTFSSLGRILRVTKYVYRFIKNILMKKDLPRILTK